MLILWSRGGLGGGHPNLFNFARINMKSNDKICIQNKLDYLKLVLKISKMRLQGDEPPEKLLQQAYEIGRLAGISEDELKNL
jgi:hypothetical protein